MAVFHFVRHGHIVKGTADPPLSPLGREEARKTAVYLQSHAISHIFASPLRRARETAEIIAATLQLPVAIEPLLRERVNWGDLPGQSFLDFIAMWDRSSEERAWQPPAGDSAQAAGQRLEQFVQEQYRRRPETAVLAVAHGGIIADFLLNVWSLAELAGVNLDFAAVPYSGEIMRHCSVTRVQFNGNQYDVQAIAQTAHLDAG